MFFTCARRRGFPTPANVPLQFQLLVPHPVEFANLLNRVLQSSKIEMLHGTCENSTCQFIWSKILSSFSYAIDYNICMQLYWDINFTLKKRSGFTKDWREFWINFILLPYKFAQPLGKGLLHVPVATAVHLPGTSNNTVLWSSASPGTSSQRKPVQFPLYMYGICKIFKTTCTNTPLKVDLL